MIARTVDQTYAQFKSELTPWLAEVPSQLLRNAAVRWYQAYQRFFQGLSGRPVRKRKGGRDSLWLTSELFQLEEARDQDGKVTGYRLFVGTSTNHIGHLGFAAGREFQTPNSITLSRERGQYFVSFNYEDGQKLKSQEELEAAYRQLDAATLEEATVGLDRGVVLPVCPSVGEPFDFTPAQKASLRHSERNIQRTQRKLARQQKGSGRRERTKRKLARFHAKQAHIRKDFAHQTSHRLVTSDKRVFVVEDLQVKNMTAAPAPKPNRSGTGYEPNGAAAKAGLNRAILQASWGRLVTFLRYKAQKHNKLMLAVPAHHSSQQCAVCGHIHPANRRSQSEFGCRKCGQTANADRNAAQVLKQRGIQYLTTKPADVSPPLPPAGTRGSARGGTVSRWQEIPPAQPATLTQPGQEEARTVQGNDQPPS